MNGRKIGVMAALLGALGLGASGARDVQDIKAQIPARVAQIDTTLENAQRAAWAEAMRATKSAGDSLRIKGTRGLPIEVKRDFLRRSRDACNAYLALVRKAPSAHNGDLTTELKNEVHNLLILDVRNHLSSEDLADRELGNLVSNLRFVLRGLEQVENFR